MADSERDYDNHVWIMTEPDDRGTYRVVLHLNADSCVPMDTQLCRQHAEYVTKCLSAAEYDAKVYRMLLKVAGSEKGIEETAAELITDLRKDRVSPLAPTPLELSPGVGSEGEPFLHVRINGQLVGQWEMDDARSHAMGMLAAPTFAEFDQAFLQALRTLVGVDEITARNIIAGLGEL